ncbi:3-deoxy-7-phosphoheptulonate synthase [Pseudonocardia sp. KRD-184]|uniref:Phospho-2-dehydro-3-deoxyheptonate aldolase n=1 Tax=Pseudonocardia oceani TaxID=2792013 RepID=A0ABS6UBU5_9PSEU|nr:3-deoxy-7-phosphoheptulonate synthase [Pseudonocardia oceani]MBW0093030.1 3-deoxy-7-phosphoheptulonate synthase [Pseudonocardia oceani]MBW0097541.1 3-deoxy-7-phosphoheptulonate synthase [Pseudonocardia oceani]MBW0110172.1 3-deoxy-7-phosphoheptulonate synthase [Pseudonocardia oceani]MBW0123570.1 3-deoxy-7-phosphoheptulonate synthase [Pseudonocardia oceani]MBW0129710.1 3-deoxy-7-phosphoheptulonate synthase [Pseudonocardia oceani]
MLTAVPALDAHRTVRVSPLISPSLLRHDLPVDDGVADTVTRARAEVVDVLDGRDDRLLVVVGPCSIHDPAAALDYAHRLAAQAGRHAGELRIVMRTYFEKPRSTVGWKGLINDPHLDGTFDVNAGLRMARRLLLEVNGLGLPVGCEFLDPITPQYLADVVSWGSIGARTAASQVHRQLCSGLSMPVGIKNGTDGDVQVAVDGVGAAAASHVFMGINPDGLAALVTTAGNPDCHVILRGGSGGPNHDAESVAAALGRMRKAGLAERVIVDASHGNSGKDHVRQAGVAREVAARLAAGDRGVVGLMLESFLVEGRQDLGPGTTYGRSVTDSCMGWDTTADVLDDLAAAVVARRALGG